VNFLSYRGKPLYEQRMWNTIYLSILYFSIFLFWILLSIGGLWFSLENIDLFSLIIGLIFSGITIVFLILTLVSIKFSKYKIYYHGIIVPAGLRKQRIRERFYNFDDIKGIKIKGKNYLYIIIGNKKIGSHYWKSNQRDKFISIFNETKNKYNNKKSKL
jgi:hypothetical protein